MFKTGKRKEVNNYKELKRCKFPFAAKLLGEQDASLQRIFIRFNLLYFQVKKEEDVGAQKNIKRQIRGIRGKERKTSCYRKCKLLLFYQQNKTAKNHHGKKSFMGTPVATRKVCPWVPCHMNSLTLPLSPSLTPTSPKPILELFGK